MKQKAKNPLFFPGILKAISQLQNSRGTTEVKILDYIQRLMLVINPSSSNTQKLRNIPQQVRRALKHATKLGLVAQKAGKYRLTIDQTQQIFKPKSNLARLKPTLSSIRGRTVRAAGSYTRKACPSCRKGRRRRGRARRNRSRNRHRRRRHSAAHLDDMDRDSKESLESDTVTL